MADGGALVFLLTPGSKCPGCIVGDAVFKDLSGVWRGTFPGYPGKCWKPAHTMMVGVVKPKAHEEEDECIYPMN